MLACAPMTAPTKPALAPREVETFCRFFYDTTGIRLTSTQRYFIDRRLEARMAACQADSLRDYLAHVRSQVSGQELQALINEMTVNETYFFREEYQFDCLVHDMLGELVAARQPGDRIRIWSIPCSTGEEPYSLAIWLLEKWPHADDFEIEIHASDIDSRALARSREGVYEERALHRVPARLRSIYFQDLGAGRWQVRPELRQSIDFSAMNVSDPGRMARMRRFDVIFCRNLLIYFDDDSRRRVTALLHDALVPGGFLCLGHSERIHETCDLFVPRKFPDALVHQKPRPGQ